MERVREGKTERERDRDRESEREKKGGMQESRRDAERKRELK